MPTPKPWLTLASRPLLALLCTLSLAAGSPAAASTSDSAQDHAQASAQDGAQSVAADLWVEARTDGGETPSNLNAGDFEIVVDGASQAPAGFAPGLSADNLVRPLDPPWRLVIYLDQSLSSAGSVRRSALALSEVARELTRLGTVEIVRADPAPRLLLPPTRDPVLVDSTLSQNVLEGGGQDELRSLRRRFAEQMQRLAAQSASYAGPGADQLTRRLDQAVSEELQLLQRQQDYLLTWLGQSAEPAAESAGGQRRVLLLVSDGFDLDPQRFYLEQLPESAAAAIGMGDRSPQFAASVAATGRALSVLGWLTVPLSFSQEAEVPAPKELGDYDRFQEAARGESGSSPWFSTSLESIRRRLKGEEEAPAAIEGPLLLEPRAPLETLAEVTGGTVLSDGRQLAPALDRLTHRVQLSCRLPPGAAERAWAVSVRSRRPGLHLASRRWLGGAMPEEVAAARARRLLAGTLEGGELEVLSSLQVPDLAATAGARNASIEARADLMPLVAGAGHPLPARVRVTVGLGNEGQLTNLVHEIRTVSDPEAAEVWTYDRQLELPAGADRAVVVVEDLDTGTWGGALAALLGADARPAQAAAGSDATLETPDLLARPKAVRLVPPGEGLLQGRVTFTARVQRAEVQKVAFFLDGEQVAVRTRPPYEARIRLGRLPTRRTLWVVGYSASGEELGRDVLQLNDSGSQFRLFITDPTQLRPGPQDVTVNLSIPVNRRMDRLELFWRDRRLATLYAPPLRQRVVIPEGESGFLRAVAYLDDGRMAEDVLLTGDSDFGEQVEIRLVELYTVVTDGEGKPVEGLQQEDFTVREDGAVQKIETFQDAGDLPLTVGLAIDSSASMFVKLPAVQQAAEDFVRSLESGRDRAFLVDFDTDPRLTRELTGDLRRVISGIETLQADGDTDLWESIVFSLLELSSLNGKKALVLFSDGAQEEEETPYQTAYDLARRVGVPIYLIVLHPGIARGDDLGLGMKSFVQRLDRLTAAVGGRVYYVPNTHNLDSIYREIEHELRSQYLLTYYSSNQGDDDRWRQIQVQLKDRRLEARTLAGYFPRRQSF